MGWAECNGANTFTFSGRITRTNELLGTIRSGRVGPSRVVVEPGAAAPFAALMTGRWVPEPGARIGVVLCGANVVNPTLAPPQALV